MAYTLQDLLDNPNLFKDIFPPKKCGDCGKLAEGEALLTSDSVPCDCRFDRLGDEIEAHPIGGR